MKKELINIINSKDGEDFSNFCIDTNNELIPLKKEYVLNRLLHETTVAESEFRINQLVAEMDRLISLPDNYLITRVRDKKIEYIIESHNPIMFEKVSDKLIADFNAYKLKNSENKESKEIENTTKRLKRAR